MRSGSSPAALLGAAALLAGCAAPSGGNEEDLRRIAREALAGRGIAPAAIQSVLIEPRVQTSQGGAKVIGYNAWTRLANCEAGYVVVTLSRLGSVEQIYGRDGCDPPELD